jgi:hypothetical protein
LLVVYSLPLLLHAKRFNIQEKKISIHKKSGKWENDPQWMVVKIMMVEKMLWRREERR